MLSGYKGGDIHTLLTNSPIHIKIALVSYHDHREVVLVFYSKNLLLESHDFDEARTARNRVNEQESFPGAHVLLAHGGVLLLSGSIQNVEERDFVIDDTLLAIRVCR